MNLQYASDLHLEFPENLAYFKHNPIKPLGDILILAGDIVPLAIMEHVESFFSYISDHFKTTYWIPGNHEYYRYDLALKGGSLYEAIRPNIYLVNNTAVETEQLKLIFSTLWSKINPLHAKQIEHAMTDFKLIRFHQNPLTSKDINVIHDESVAFLKKELSEDSTVKKVVTTHHVPTFRNYPIKFKDSILNEAFGVELSDLIELYQPDYWIYGHIHKNTPDFNIGKTTLLTNQMGYVKHDEQKRYKTNAIIMII